MASKLLDQLVVSCGVVVQLHRHVEVAHVAERTHADSREKQRALLLGVGDAVCLQEEIELCLVELPLDGLRIEAVERAEDARVGSRRP